MKSKVVILLVGLSAVVASPASAANQFDLECAGEQLRVALTVGKWDRVAWRGVVKVDLDAGLFCEDECRAAQRIFAIGPEIVTFASVKSVDLKDNSSINRLTGIYRRVYQQSNTAPAGEPMNDRQVFTDGRCVVKPFTGFPKTMF